MTLKEICSSKILRENILHKFTTRGISLLALLGHCSLVNKSTCKTGSRLD